MYDPVLLKLPIDSSPSISFSSLKLDYSQQGLSKEIIHELMVWAEENNLKSSIHQLFSGAKVNRSQGLPSLHTALRFPRRKYNNFYTKETIDQIIYVQQMMRDMSKRLREGIWLGGTGKPINSVVNIGVGGSDLGPKLCVDALKNEVTHDLKFYFISDVDPDELNDVISKLDPETTLLIVSSKSWMTLETLHNMEQARAWIGASYWPQQSIAVTAHPERAKNMGFSHILPLLNCVGGRYSVCSGIGLIVAIAIGFDRFTEFLEGAHTMDEHFYHRDFHENMPVMMGLIGCWNINYLNIPTHLFLIYTKRLRLFVPYMQQLDMESNGKSVNQEGQSINYRTGPIVWGGLGNQAQHSYFQLLTQGQHPIAADFISLKSLNDEPINDYCYQAMQILRDQERSDAHANLLNSKKLCAINHLQLDSLTPFSLGLLIALYEHKIYTQSVLWNINAFDQPGVQRLKKLKLKLKSVKSHA
jgi:glucose-6-phosphate isomerase